MKSRSAAALLTRFKWCKKVKIFYFIANINIWKSKHTGQRKIVVQTQLLHNTEEGHILCYSQFEIEYCYWKKCLKRIYNLLHSTKTMKNWSARACKKHEHTTYNHEIVKWKQIKKSWEQSDHNDVCASFLWRHLGIICKNLK